MKNSCTILRGLLIALFILVAGAAFPNGLAFASANRSSGANGSAPLPSSVAAPPSPGGPAAPPGSTGGAYPPGPSRPESTLTVTNPDDSGAGSLRQAISTALSGDTINFDPSLAGQVITLTSGPLVVGQSLVIDGSSLATHLSLSGNKGLTVLDINNNATLTLVGLAVINGYGTNGGGAVVETGATLSLAGCQFSGNAASNFGGGIYNAGSLIVNDSLITKNLAGWGGGIENRLGALTVTNTVFDGNTATSGGAGVEVYGGTVTIDRSAFTNNIASDGATNGSGGGFQSDPGTGNVSLINLTFSGNQARGTADDGGGAIMSYGGTLYLTNLTMSNNLGMTHGGGVSTNPGYATEIYLQNTLVSGNTSSGGAASDLFGAFHSQDYNLIGTLNGATLADTTTHNQIGVDPQLNYLADNGGSNMSFELLPGSPAIDAIPAGVNGCGGTLVSDQRGKLRPANYPDYPGGCDIGAFERQADETYTAALSDGGSLIFGATLTRLQDNPGGNTPGLTTVTRSAAPSASFAPGNMPFWVNITAALSSGLDANLSLCYTGWEAARQPAINPNRLELYHKVGGVWQRIGADTRITDSATGVTCVTKNNVSDLGLWVLADPSLPTAVTVAGFSAQGEIDRVEVTWQTGQEVATVGFNLYRSTSPDEGSPRQKLNAALIPAQNFGAVWGAAYAFSDVEARPGIQYYYWLEAVNTADLQLFGPQPGQADYGLYLPVIRK